MPKGVVFFFSGQGSAIRVHVGRDGSSLAEMAGHTRCSCNSVIQQSASCLAVQITAWAAQYNTWLLIQLMPKSVVFCFQDETRSFIWSAVLLCRTRLSSLSACWPRWPSSCNSMVLHSLIWSVFLLFRTRHSSLNAYCCLAIQDKAQQSERMLAEMAAQMQQLRVEKEELQGRNKLLESLLKVQQQQQHDSCSGGRRLDASQVWVQFVLHLSC